MLFKLNIWDIYRCDIGIQKDRQHSLMIAGGLYIQDSYTSLSIGENPGSNVGGSELPDAESVMPTANMINRIPFLIVLLHD